MKVVVNFWIIVAIVLGAAILLPGPKPVIPTAPDVVVDCLDPSLAKYAPLWEKEVGRRFHNVVAVLCHGGDQVRGNWIVLDQPGSVPAIGLVQNLIAIEEAKYPGRMVVLLCCNPAHYVLHGFPEVYYSPASVWCEPDRDIKPSDFTNGNARAKIDDGDDPDDYDPAPVSSSSVSPADDHSRSEEDYDTTGNIFEFLQAN
jgi:hypothetical protein